MRRRPWQANPAAAPSAPVTDPLPADHADGGTEQFLKLLSTWELSESVAPLGGTKPCPAGGTGCFAKHGAGVCCRDAPPGLATRAVSGSGVRWHGPTSGSAIAQLFDLELAHSDAVSSSGRPFQVQQGLRGLMCVAAT